jgi:hypothetical protein
MSIDIYFSARRTSPLTPAEQSTLHDVIERANAGRRAEWCAAYDDPKYPDPNVDRYGRFTFGDVDHPWYDTVVFPPSGDRTPYLFSGSVQMPLVDRWDIVLPLLEHWCDAFSEVRESVDAESWHASMDDFEFDWDCRRQRYVVPDALDSEQYRASAEFSLQRRL